MLIGYRLPDSWLVFVLAIGLVPALSFGVERYFIGHNAAWNDPALWSGGALPTAGDTGIIAGESGSPRLARYVTGGDLPGPPDAIRILPYGELQLYDAHMTAEHNLVLAGGRLSTYNWYQCHSTITLEEESSVGGRGTAWFYLYGRIKDGATTGRLRIDNSTVELRSLLNTYSAGTVVGTNGILLTTRDNMIGTGTLTLEPGGTFRYGYDKPMTVTNTIIVHNGRLWGWNNLHYLTAPSGIRVKGDVEIYTTAKPQSINTVISDYDAATPGRVVKTGSGFFSLSGAMTNNCYSGGTLIRQGDLGLNYNVNNVFGGGPVTVCAGGRLTFVNNNIETNLVILENGGEITSQTGNPFATLSGTILLNGTGIISSTAPSYFSFTGKFKDYDAATKGRLIVSNGSANAASQLRLNTTDQEYSGGTHVKKGLAHAPSMPPVGTVRVDDGAHLLLTKTTDHALGGLAGNGEVELKLAQGRTLTCNEGFAPGVTELAGDTLTITGATGRVAIDAGATSSFRLRDPANHDKVVLRGGVALTLGGDLRVEELDGDIAVGHYTIYELHDGALPDGAFANLVLPNRYTGKVVIEGSRVILSVARLGTIMLLR